MPVSRRGLLRAPWASSAACDLPVWTDPHRRGKNKGAKHAFLLRDRRLSHHAVIYVPTGLVVMALRNASGEVTVEMVCVPSPTP